MSRSPSLAEAQAAYQSFLSLDSPRSSFDGSDDSDLRRHSASTSLTSEEQDSPTAPQFATFGLHVPRSGLPIPFEPDDDDDGDEPDSPTQGNFEALMPNENHRESVGSVSSFGSYGSSYSSIDRRPPSTCLSFRSNGPLRLETPPPSKRGSARSSLGSQLSVSSTYAYDARIEHAKVVRYSAASSLGPVPQRSSLSPAEQYLASIRARNDPSPPPESVHATRNPPALAHPRPRRASPTPLAGLRRLVNRYKAGSAASHH